MAEKKVKCDVYIVKMICDKCGKGEMIESDDSILTYPPQFPHMCNNCGYTATYRCRYPHTKLEEEGQENGRNYIDA